MGLGLQGRDHEVAAREPDRVLHVALLVAGIRVAEPGLDPVAGKERVEHRGERHMAFRVTVARTGGVVEHEHGRHPADMPEHRKQPVAQAFWIDNGVLDRFLEDESLFGEFLRTPVSEGGVESLVVGPPHIVVEVGA